jgi:hypothetical protein
MVLILKTMNANKLTGGDKNFKIVWKKLSQKERQILIDRSAASQIGMSYAEYIAKHAAGLLRCCKCKQWKQHESYYKEKQRSSGRSATCIECMKAYDKTPQSRYCDYRAGARARKLDFLLTFEEFQTFWQKPCFWCEEPIETVGIDRIDNRKGYFLANCVPCCHPCNKMKMEAETESWLNRIRRISAKHPAST